ncbi:hypothetical protein Mapa_015735 [Marchantia paleacea]|nr:hypothetical protein Mapa_015735 [Marchantia paleacea]
MYAQMEAQKFIPKQRTNRGPKVITVDTSASSSVSCLIFRGIQLPNILSKTSRERQGKSPNPFQVPSGQEEHVLFDRSDINGIPKGDSKSSPSTQTTSHIWRQEAEPEQDRRTHCYTQKLA